ncbi:MAG: Nif11-like leader peptide family RiPP precursor [Lachnospiraceae bacterium]|nr:Nif11-like leader peptide family RiPP precursor [Lachnospiraceae bacterium]
MNYIDFKKKVINDKSFAGKFKDCKDLPALIEAAAREGYIFTEDDVKNNTELLPEELASAAGGKFIGTSSFDCVYASNTNIVICD